MAERSNIEWCDHTFNPWIGCQKVSSGCDNCYAEARDRRFHSGIHWGPRAPRRRTTADYWKQPAKWNRQAEARGAPFLVFGGSECDPFDKAAPPGAREDYFAVIRDTPHLIWILVSKRPENYERYLPSDWGEGYPNVWMLVSVEDQPSADHRIPILLDTPAALRGASAEPLLAGVNFAPWLPGCHECAVECGWRSGDAPPEEKCGWCGAVSATHGEFCAACGGQDFSGVCPRCDANVVQNHPDTPCLNWIIVGGQSGHGAQDSHLAHHRGIIAQCRAAGVPVFEKQLGARPVDENGRVLKLKHPKGGNPAEWPPDLQGVREYPVIERAAA